MEKNLKKQLSVLVHLANSDDDFTQTEKEAIKKIAINKGVSALEIDLLFKDPESTNSLKLSYDEKTDLLIYMLQVLMSDKEIHDNEEGFSKMIATKIGFREEVIDFLINYNTIEQKAMKQMMEYYLDK